MNILEWPGDPTTEHLVLVADPIPLNCEPTGLMMDCMTVLGQLGRIFLSAMCV